MEHDISNTVSAIPVNIEDELKRSYLDYAMSVIVGRAIPDVRDGLKPVHRRILYAMYELKNFATQPYKKSARVVGDVIGKYHPHGDTAVYDALVRMAQDFSMRLPLVDGQGNFGSIDGDPPAAMRYTEVRMDPASQELTAELGSDTVDWDPNYDESLKEPVVLPTRFPNFLVNGAGGIAVGMATSVPPHNMGEVIDATIMLMRDPDVSWEQIEEALPGPDFPTGGEILGRAGIKAAYRLGRGAIQIRGITDIECSEKSGRERIVITELPFQVNKARLLERIGELVKEKKILGISAIRDESDRTGMRAVVELKRDAVSNVVLNQLYKLTTLQTSFGVINLAINNGRPQLMNIRETLQAFVDFRKEVVTRRCRWELNQAETRAHVLEGLQIALDNIDLVVSLIRGAPDQEKARALLMSRLELSIKQAVEILRMRLGRLTTLERDKIAQELNELKETIGRLTGILSDQEKMRDLIIDELNEVRKQYANERRTLISDREGEIEIESLIPEEDMVITVSHLGYIKRTPLSVFRAQHRGGRGLAGMDTRDGDFVTQIFVASTHNHVLFFSDRGKVYLKKIYQIPQAARVARGRAIVNFVGTEPGEKIAAVLPVSEFKEGWYVLTASRMGYVKKTDLMAFSSVRQTGIRGVGIDEGDGLVGADIIKQGSTVILGTQDGYAIHFAEEQVRPMGRTARGVKGIDLREGDRVVGMGVLTGNRGDILTVCEFGYGKRTRLEEYRVQKRGGMGIITIKTTERNGKVVSLSAVEEGQDLMMITDRGIIIRMNVSDISIVGRNTQGVRLIRLSEGESVVGVEPFIDEEAAGACPDEESVPNVEPGTEI